MSAVAAFELAANEGSPFYEAIRGVAHAGASRVELFDGCAGFAVWRSWLDETTHQNLFDCVAQNVLAGDSQGAANQAIFFQAEHFPDALRPVCDALGASIAILNELPCGEAVSFGHELAARVPLFDQLIVNRYAAGDGIKEHIDLAGFDDGVVGLSLGAPCVFSMRLRDGDGAVLQQHDVTLHAGDVYVIKQDARWRWTHAIDGRSIEAPRISLTFRRLKR